MIELHKDDGFIVLDGVIPVMDTPIEEFCNNIKESRKLSLREIHDLPEWRASYPVAVIGGGPSLAGELEDLKKFKVTFAAGSVHDYLVRNGVVPKYCVVVDPSPIMNGYLQLASRDTMYLVSSACSMSTFELLRSKNVPITVFHCGGSVKDNLSTFGENQVVIGGGATVGGRTIIVAYSFGYTDIHLFGMDTCITDRHHAYDFVDSENEKIDKILDIRLGDVTFKMAGYMVCQLFDFKYILEVLGHTIRFTVHGDGALKTLMELGKQKVQKNGD